MSASSMRTYAGSRPGGRNTGPRSGSPAASKIRSCAGVAVALIAMLPAAQTGQRSLAAALGWFLTWHGQRGLDTRLPCALALAPFPALGTVPFFWHARGGRLADCSGPIRTTACKEAGNVQ